MFNIQPPSDQAYKIKTKEDDADANSRSNMDEQDDENKGRENEYKPHRDITSPFLKENIVVASEKKSSEQIYSRACHTRVLTCSLLYAGVFTWFAVT